MSKRKDKLQGDLGAFLKQYQRKANPTRDPNDRKYSREFEKKMKAMKPEDLSELMNGEGGDLLADEEEAWLSGHGIPGVQYCLSDVVIADSRGAGIIIAILKTHPVPMYLVELHSGEIVEAYQDAMSRSGT